MTSDDVDVNGAADEIEAEDTGAEEADAKPWDPSQIRVMTKSYSLRQIVDEIGDGSIDLAPDFQRDYVWKERQKTRLIESILLGIPLPAFYFNANKDNTSQVVDGVQRLSTVRDFASGALELTSDLEYLQELKGFRFSHLDASLRRRFHQTQIVVHVIEATSPPEVKYDIFKRINTGGSPLTPQEIRHCMSRDRSRQYLRELATLPAFKSATQLRSVRRMEDRELVLRYVAFARLFEQSPMLKGYEQYDTLDRFLLQTSNALDSTSEISEQECATLKARFERAMAHALAIFGEHAFRRWLIYTDRRAPLNKALFESWTVILAQYPEATFDEAAVAQIRENARISMTEDFEYIDSISNSTGRYKRVRFRFQTAHNIVKSVLS